MKRLLWWLEHLTNRYLGWLLPTKRTYLTNEMLDDEYTRGDDHLRNDGGTLKGFTIAEEVVTNFDPALFHCANCARLDWDDISRSLWQYGVPPQLMDEARASVCRLSHRELDAHTAVFGPDGIQGAPMFVDHVARLLRGQR